MYAEITQELFSRVVTSNVICHRVENLEHASKAYFVVDSVVFLKIDNYLSCTSQYYIQDINV